MERSIETAPPQAEATDKAKEVAGEAQEQDRGGHRPGTRAPA